MQERLRENKFSEPYSTIRTISPSTSVIPTPFIVKSKNSNGSKYRKKSIFSFINKIIPYKKTMKTITVILFLSIALMISSAEAGPLPVVVVSCDSSSPECNDSSNSQNTADQVIKIYVTSDSQTGSDTATAGVKHSDQVIKSDASSSALSTVDKAATICSGIAVCLLLIGIVMFMRGRWKRNSTSEDTSKDTAPKVFTVFRKHTPDYIDGVELNLGDFVIIQEKFDDGWAFGLNITTNNQGSFPLICLSVLSANENVEQVKSEV
jgi:hypothetical protein